ncbi:MAG: Uma2 family endonuclease [Spirochaetes bacterium]|nr:Uma2 family endonuclease [Spirochaetota bacterium]
MKADFGRRIADGFTYKDYLEWDEGNRWELLDGFPFMMAAPNRKHQDMVFSLARQLGNWLEGKPCRPYIAPFDVRLFPKDDLSDKDVVQPDVLAVCDQNKITDAGIIGAPDFVIEVISPWSRTRDLIEKRRLYEKAGVKEYWAVDLDGKKLHKYLLKNGIFEESIKDFEEGSPEAVSVLEGCILKF